MHRRLEHIKYTFDLITVIHRGTRKIFSKFASVITLNISYEFKMNLLFLKGTRGLNGTFDEYFFAARFPMNTLQVWSLTKSTT